MPFKYSVKGVKDHVQHYRGEALLNHQTQRVLKSPA